MKQIGTDPRRDGSLSVAKGPRPQTRVLESPTPDRYQFATGDYEQKAEPSDEWLMVGSQPATISQAGRVEPGKPSRL